MTQPLNRLATLRYAGPYTLQPIRYGYGAPAGSGLPLASGQWRAFGNAPTRARYASWQGGNSRTTTTEFSLPVRASALAAATSFQFARTDSVGRGINPLAVSPGDTLALYGPSGTLAFPVTASGGNEAANLITLSVSAGTLTGDDFEIAAGVTVGFSGVTGNVSGPAEERDVWCRIVERGADAGIVAIQSTADVAVVRETADFRIRFIPPNDYSLLISIRDDLGRVWTVRSANASRDRRYLDLEALRDAS